MKTAIYIEQGVVQLVLTPENQWEQSTLASFSDKPLGVKIFNGTFYACAGGWIRQNHNWGSGYREEAHSLILRIEDAKQE